MLCPCPITPARDCQAKAYPPTVGSRPGREPRARRIKSCVPGIAGIALSSYRAAPHKGVKHDQPRKSHRLIEEVHHLKGAGHSRCKDCRAKYGAETLRPPLMYVIDRPVDFFSPALDVSYVTYLVEGEPVLHRPRFTTQNQSCIVAAAVFSDAQTLHVLQSRNETLGLSLCCRPQVVRNSTRHEQQLISVQPKDSGESIDEPRRGLDFASLHSAEVRRVYADPRRNRAEAESLPLPCLPDDVPQWFHNATVLNVERFVNEKRKLRFALSCPPVIPLKLHLARAEKLLRGAGPLAAGE